jgi:hypothetical protein
MKPISKNDPILLVITIGLIAIGFIGGMYLGSILYNILFPSHFPI